MEGGEPLVLPEEVGLHSGEYKKLFGRTFGEGHESKPWKRGIVRVCGEKKIKMLRKEEAKRPGKSSSSFVFADTAKRERPMIGRIFIP